MKLPIVVGKLPVAFYVTKLPTTSCDQAAHGGTMQYKTVVGPANTIDNDVNHLAAEGWLVHSFIVTGAMDIETEDEQVVMEMPILSYLMMRETPEAEMQENGRPARKVLGRATV